MQVNTDRSEQIYTDNAATSFPKPPEVLAAMVHYAQRTGASAGRGGYAQAMESAEIIMVCRQRLNTLFHGENPNHFVFTLNCTDALNMAIGGWLKSGDHAICTAMDHNSILRPLHELTRRGIITQTRVAADHITGLVDPQAIAGAIRPNTRLIAVGHGSNVTGTVQPIAEIGQIAKRHNIAFLVDAAQTAGHIPLDVQKDKIDFLAAPGHKGLLGPLGTGFLYIRPGLEDSLCTLRQGGTGSISDQDIQPTFMPDKFESGSHNAIGIAGLSAGLAWILKRGITSLANHQRELCAAFIESLRGIEGLRFMGPQGVEDRVGVFSVRLAGHDPLRLAAQLEKDFGILTRAGLHCAPGAHETMGTHTRATPDPHGAAGTTRLSFGPFLTARQVRFCGEALATITAGATVAGRKA